MTARRTDGGTAPDRPLSAAERWRLLVRCEGRAEAEVAALLAAAGVGEGELSAWRRRTLEALEPRDEERPAVEVVLFGQPRVEAREPVRWPHGRCLEVLAFLATRPEHRASRPDLVVALWPAASEEVVARNLHPTVSGARRALRDAGVIGDPIPHRSGSWSLSHGVDWRIDVEGYLRDLELGLAEGDPARAAELLARAWSVRRGELLEGSRSPWVEEERRVLQTRHRRLLESLGTRYRTLGRPEDALDAFRALLAEEPLAENAHVAVMEIYAEIGRPDLVRRQFLRLQEVLAEIEVEPSEATQRRIRQLLGA